MMETQRLLEQGATDAERALLQSARADAPGEGAAQRTLAAVAVLTAGGPGVPGPGQELGMPGAPAPATAHLVQLGALAKVGLVALFGVGALGVGVLVHRTTGQRAVPGETPGARARIVQSVTAAGSAGLPTDDSLSAEIRILDDARRAVDARNPAAAQRALEGYAERFPQGHLKPEASVLQLAVLVQLGKREAAGALAAQLLASKQYEAYQVRIRSLLREAGE